MAYRVKINGKIRELDVPEDMPLLWALAHGCLEPDAVTARAGDVARGFAAALQRHDGDVILDQVAGARNGRTLLRWCVLGDDAATRTV